MGYRLKRYVECADHVIAHRKVCAAAFAENPACKLRPFKLSDDAGNVHDAVAKWDVSCFGPFLLRWRRRVVLQMNRDETLPVHPAYFNRIGAACSQMSDIRNEEYTTIVGQIKKALIESSFDFSTQRMVSEFDSPLVKEAAAYFVCIACPYV